MKNRITAAGIAILIMLFAVCVSAAQTIAPDSVGSITVNVSVYRGAAAVASGTPVPLSGAAVYAYRIADMRGTPLSFQFTPTSEYDGFAEFSGGDEMRFDWPDTAGWDAFAIQVVNYIRSVNGEPLESGSVILPAARGYTDGSGQVVFDELPAGLYLIYIAPVTAGGYHYEFGTPAFVSMPTVTPGVTIDRDTEWEYEVSVNPKPPEGKPVVPPDEPDIPVIPPPPPPPPPPETEPPETDPPETEPPETEPPETEPEPPDFPEFEDIPDEPPPQEPPDVPEAVEPPDEIIPQTGMLWWPVPVFLIGGMFLIVVGMILRRNTIKGRD